MSFIPPLSDSATAEREIVITRLLKAPRELVFQVWTDSKHLSQWWGPKGFTTTVTAMDVRPGGAWQMIMHGPDGTNYTNDAVYDEVVPPERLAYTHWPDPANDFGGFHVQVTFEEQANETLLTLRMRFDSVAEREKVAAFGAVEGGNSTLDCLEEHLSAL